MHARATADKSTDEPLHNDQQVSETLSWTPSYCMSYFQTPSQNYLLLKRLGF